MQGLKSAILVIFQNGLGWLCPVSEALKNPSDDVKNYFLSWVSMNISKDRKAKLKSAYSFMLKYSKTTVFELCLVFSYSKCSIIGVEY